MRVLVLLLLVALPGAAAKAVWIDTDPSVARGEHEVDDGFALAQAFRSPELAVRGVSVVFGNAPLEQAYPIAQELMQRYAPQNVPLYRGAAGSRELGVETQATRAMEAALRKEPLTILVLGPATNIASVIRNHPDLVPRIVEVIAVAGRRQGQKFRTAEDVKPFRDFNFEQDPQAFQTLLDARVPLVLAPWEISSKIWLKAADLDALSKRDPSLGFIIEPARDWLAFWKRELKADGFNPFDTLAIGYAIAPEKFRCDAVSAAIRTLPDDTGSGGAKPYLLREEQRPGSKVRYCYEALPGFKEDLLRRLGAHAHEN